MPKIEQFKSPEESIFDESGHLRDSFLDTFVEDSLSIKSKDRNKMYKHFVDCKDGVCQKKIDERMAQREHEVKRDAANDR